MDLTERWPGYNRQSWKERFEELNRQYTASVWEMANKLPEIAARHRLTAEQAKDAEIAEMRALLRTLGGLLRRYRTETPPGHSPHMICHKADEALAQLDTIIAKQGEGK